MSSIESGLIGSSSDVSFSDDSSSEAKINSSSIKSCSLSNELTSSNCEKVIMLPVCSWEDVEYRMNDTAGCVASASEYGHGVYTNAL